MKHNQQVGKWGEDAAATYLVEHGLIIIERNVRTPYGEIDIVAKLDEEEFFAHYWVTQEGGVEG